MAADSFFAMKFLQRANVFYTLYDTCPRKGEQKQRIQVVLKDMIRVYTNHKSVNYTYDAVRIVRNVLSLQASIRQALRFLRKCCMPLYSTTLTPHSILDEQLLLPDNGIILRTWSSAAGW